LTDFLDNITGGGGLIAPVVDSPWGVILLFALGIAIGFKLGRWKK